MRISVDIIFIGLSLLLAQATQGADLESLQEKADQGDAEAQFNLGFMYDKGEGVSKDDVEAVKWCRKAADQGFATAQFNLGLMYASGIGVPKEEIQAYKWFILASKSSGLKKHKHRVEDSEFFLTPEQIVEGKRLAAEFKLKKTGE